MPVSTASLTPTYESALTSRVKGPSRCAGRLGPVEWWAVPTVSS